MVRMPFDRSSWNKTTFHLLQITNAKWPNVFLNVYNSQSCLEEKRNHTSLNGWKYSPEQQANSIIHTHLTPYPTRNHNDDCLSAKIRFVSLAWICLGHNLLKLVKISIARNDYFIMKFIWPLLVSMQAVERSKAARVCCLLLKIKTRK